MKRKLQVWMFFLMLGLAAAPMVAVAGKGSTEQLLKKAEELMGNYRDSEALAMYEEVLQAAPDNYTALCKASYLNCRIGERVTDEGTKVAFYLKGKEYASRAYELNPKDAESNYAMAVSLGAMAMVSGPKQRLAGITQMKSFLDAALASNKEHAGAWHLLGRWYFKMANLNFAEAAASKMFFGGVCGEATNEEAANAIQTAIKYNPMNIQYYYDLAMVYKELKSKESCTETLKQAIALDVTTKDELELARRCKIMLQEYSK
jgi:regulator of microtubule dynamics protein 3